MCIFFHFLSLEAHHNNIILKRNSIGLVGGLRLYIIQRRDCAEFSFSASLDMVIKAIVCILAVYLYDLLDDSQRFLKNIWGPGACCAVCRIMKFYITEV